MAAIHAFLHYSYRLQRFEQKWFHYPSFDYTPPGDNTKSEPVLLVVGKRPWYHPLGDDASMPDLLTP